MATFMSALLGCNAIDDKAIKPIEEGLSKKYGKKFTVSALGDRIGRDTATAYVYADDDPTMRFVTRVNKEGEIVFENYAYRLVCRTVEKKINEAFAENGFETVCFAEFSNCKYDVPLDTSISDYIEVSGSKSISVAIAAKKNDKLSGEQLEMIYWKIHCQMTEIESGFSLYVLSANDYDKIYKKIQTETQLFGSTRFGLYGTEDDITEIYAEISDGKLSKTANEINNTLFKGGD